MRALLVIAVTASTASADNWLFDQLAPSEPAPAHFALAVNDPIGWLGDQKSLGISAYAGITDQLAVRANFATYSNDRSITATLGECSLSGRTYDGSLGLQYYFLRHLYDGPFVEAGVLRRDDPTMTASCDDPHIASMPPAGGVHWAGEALFGWTLSPELARHHLFVSSALGFSQGRDTAAVEWMFRLGAAF